MIDPKSGALYVGVGSVGNVGVEPEPRATIRRFDPDGSNQSTVVSGTRNRRHSPFIPTPASSGHWCRSATASATICRPII
jgi:hypothetical protein